MKNKTSLLLAVPLSFTLIWATPVHAAPDAESAQALYKKEKCNKCHAPDKSKDGPSFKKIAAKYKGKPDAEEKVIKAFTTGPKVKLEDGTEEEHKIIKTKDPAQRKNLAQWILSF
jgi:cytochrome c